MSVLSRIDFLATEMNHDSIIHIPALQTMVFNIYLARLVNYCDFKYQTDATKKRGTNRNQNPAQMAQSELFAQYPNSRFLTGDAYNDFTIRMAMFGTNFKGQFAVTCLRQTMAASK
jgi:hypothetical protein